MGSHLSDANAKRDRETSPLRRPCPIRCRAACALAGLVPAQVASTEIFAAAYSPQQMQRYSMIASRTGRPTQALDTSVRRHRVAQVAYLLLHAQRRIGRSLFISGERCASAVVVRGFAYDLA